MGYPRERKEAVLKKMLPPNNRTISEISKEEGICEGTLYNWRKAARSQGRLMPDGDRTPTGWCAADKFAAVVESAAMNESELSAYCREHGMSNASFYKWHAKFGGMDASMMKRVKELEDENRRLKKMYAYERLKAEMVQEALAKKW
ncbi:Mobile element protein [hydrothermal vent metagenome]|uniref:Mobile element protein n=1 Tax=hydrothermal vent metagenome TaxID=652676 RepID=A0A3B0THM6_9ZZZZ